MMYSSMLTISYILLNYCVQHNHLESKKEIYKKENIWMDEWMDK